MDTSKIQIKDFPAVSNTALMTLYCRAMDYRAKHSILNDKFSFDLYSKIEFDWKTVKKRVRTHDNILTAIRVRKMDQMCKEFLKDHPKGVVVSLGSGLDYRFARIDNGQFTLVELDLSEVFDFKKRIIPPSPRNIFIGKSVTDYSWIKTVKELQNSLQTSVFFIAEGLIPYFEKSDLQELFKNMSIAFPKSRIFFDVCGENTVKMMSKHSGIQDWNVQLKSGFKSGHDFENWGFDFKLIEEWYLSDDPDAKRGLMKLMWIIPMFKYWLFFIHGQFEKST